MAVRILLVEDDPDSLMGLSRLLRLGGFEVTTAANGRAALELLQSEARFDVLLTDMMLPDVDGFELARAARQRDPRTLIVLATGDAQFDTDSPHHRPYFDLSFVKPLRMAEVLESLRNELRLRRGPVEP
ncbi:MAG: hypothetical protein KatS3mg108_0605 [Isosphaeraceae bacterium]|jgi:CheY-like chemotaxis protein|nr:MAG: hypothetical protein KatS3mg108_0605 [Isosphaeraceae bacterium]